MIIAWGLFILSLLSILGTWFMFVDEKEMAGMNFIIWFVIALVSAQYIWG